MRRGKRDGEATALDDEPLWYKDAVIYELHVRAFCDGNGDGIGDFAGLTDKLDYLQDLGVTALWLLPFYPSPLRDDGYDIASYTDIHPNYGTLHDFRTFLREAHARGLRIITELVLNHTSDQHPWFQRAREAKPGSRARDFYVWSESTEKYPEARIIFKDFEPSNWAWDPVAKAYYWHRFYSHQPDLNFDNPDVHKAVLEALDFWLDMGVDGLRLDAVPYLYEREGTHCENLAETHRFLKSLRRHVDRQFKQRMLLAEANQWPEEAVPYFGDGDECHMAFHFPLMPRLFMALHMEDRYPIIDILRQTPAIPANTQWALFLRNHDELTLEMVTDEDRDYMYKVYANDPRARINLGIRRRLLPLLGNNRRKYELLKSLLFSLPGTPVIYYGDEIGMGDNIYLGDRNGVRTPMQWSADRNAGFSRANPQRLYLPVIIDPEYHFEAVNVEAQHHNLGSLLWWTKRLILLRKRFRCFGHGSIEFLYPENRKILAFVRRCGDEVILVVANLSRFVHYAELDLSAYRGMRPIELFGQTAFPVVGDAPYFLTLGPHSFYWFTLEPPSGPALEAHATEPAVIEMPERWQDVVLTDEGRAELERILPAYIGGRRWFGGKSRRLRAVRIGDAIPLPTDGDEAFLLTADVQYNEGPAETYVLPLAFAGGAAETGAAARIEPDAVIAALRVAGSAERGVLYDALSSPRFCSALLDIMARRRRFKGERGEVVAFSGKALRNALGAGGGLEPSPVRREQSNTSVVYGDRLILKMFRRLQEGTNPEVEIGRFLTERTTFAAVAALAGGLEYRPATGEPASLAVLRELVPNEGDAWSYTLDQLEQFYEEALARVREEPVIPEGHILDLANAEIPATVRDRIGSYLASAELLGRRTGELHTALASDTKDPAFAPEPFDPFHRRALYESVRALADRAFTRLGKTLRALPEETRAAAEQLAARKDVVLGELRHILEARITAKRIRCHGDYHLGQVLYTGKDFVIIDFEGEPARSIGERRLKRAALRDVAGMLRSFDYAAARARRNERLPPAQMPLLARWARFWCRWTGVGYLKEYLAATAGTDFLPSSQEERKRLLDFLLLEKALYELGYELDNRPDWIDVPVQGILEMVPAKA